MRPKDYIVLVILAWWLLRDQESADVHFTITEPGFEDETIGDNQ